MAHDVFISYSSKDKAVADSIVASFEQEKIRCWYAPRDIQPGADWGEEIANAIKKCRVFLLIFSGSANRSQRVLDELNLAITTEIAILPFRIEKLEPSGAMQLHLSARHWLDAFSPSWEKHIELLTQTISSHIREGDSLLRKPGDVRFSEKIGKKNASKVIILIGIFSVLILGAIFGIPRLTQKMSGKTEEIPVTMEASEINSEQMASPSDSMSPLLGSPENPIVWMFVPSDFIEFKDVKSAVDSIASSFHEKNNDLTLSIIPASSMDSLVNALCDGKAHMGSLDALPFITALMRDCAEAKLIWQGALEDIKYSGEVLVQTGSIITDLSMLEGKRVCIPDETSMSGWVLPSLEIRAKYGDPNDFFEEIIPLSSHNAVVENLYNSQCDAGFVYYDIREFSTLPDIKERLSIISTSIAIPNQNISFTKAMDEKIAQRIIRFLISESQSNDQFANIPGITNATDVTNARDTIVLTEINDYYYEELMNLFIEAEANPGDYY